MFSERLKEARKAKGLSQKEIANKLFISQQAYAKYETGTASPNPETLSKISKELNVNTDYLLGVSENAQKEKSLADLDTQLDGIYFAFSKEFKELSDDNKKTIIEMARLLKERENK